LPEVAIGAKSIGVQHTIEVPSRVEFWNWLALTPEPVSDKVALLVALLLATKEESAKKPTTAMTPNNLVVSIFPHLMIMISPR
jgi:hypothetical protein